MGKAAKKETPKRVPFNWAKLKKMAESGASIVEMAEATDPHYRTSKSDDKTKPTRARLSIAANKGVRIEGRIVRFKRRVKAQTEKQSKAKADSKKASNVAKPTAKKAKPNAAPKPTVVAKPEEPKPQPEA
jgi:hypothetical protein